MKKRNIAKHLSLTAAFVGMAVPGILLAEDTGEAYSDTWLQTKLVTTYTLNRELSVFDVDTNVKDQVAHLSGVVDSEAKKELATEIAKSIEGIKTVDNQIVVKKSVAKKTVDPNERSYGQIIDDLTTTASIKSKLLTNSAAHGMAVNIDTMKGIVTLKGEVDSGAEKELIEKIAENTDGVAKVNNQLRVKKATS